MGSERTHKMIRETHKTPLNLVPTDPYIGVKTSNEEGKNRKNIYKIVKKLLVFI